MQVRRPTIDGVHTRTDFGDTHPEWDALEARWMSELAVGGPGARDALALLFKAYGRLFERRLIRMGCESQAPDIAQGLWMEIARAAPRYRQDRPVRIFLLGFLKNGRMRYFSSLKKEPKLHELSPSQQAEGTDSQDEASTSDSKLGPEWVDFERCVRRALSKFEARHPYLSKLLLLRHVEELSLEEIIQDMGGSTDRAKADLFSARKKMAPLINPCIDLWPDRPRSKA